MHAASNKEKHHDDRVLMPAVDEPIIISIKQPPRRRTQLWNHLDCERTKEHLQLLARALAALGAGRLLGQEVWRGSKSVTDGEGRGGGDGLLW